MIDGLKATINEFDEKNIIKQIILIGDNGAIRNIELDVEVEDG